MHEIKEDVLKAIAEALRIHSPDLLPFLHQSIKAGTAELPNGAGGSLVYGKLKGNIAWEEGEKILRVLESIEQAHGYKKQFGGRNINWLVVCWREFSQPRQLPCS